MSISSATSIAPATTVVQPSAKGAAQRQPAILFTPAAKGSTESKPKVPTDTVSISSAGKAALEEAKETAVQTANEARAGDHQAQRALAKAAASAAQRK